jgi:hypothetical protein
MNPRSQCSFGDCGVLREFTESEPVKARSNLPLCRILPHFANPRGGERLLLPSALSLSRFSPFVARTAVSPQRVKQCVCPQHRALRRGLASVQDVAPWVAARIGGSRSPKLRDEPREIVSCRATRRP